MSESLQSQCSALQQRAVQRLSALLPAEIASHPQYTDKIAQLAVVSDFAIDTLQRQPDILLALLHDDGATPVAAPVLTLENQANWSRLLRRYRHAESTRLIWRDALGLDSVDATLHGSTVLAERCITLALEATQTAFAQRHGWMRDSNGTIQPLIVFGLGKLGGGALNFSSDVDLVYAHANNDAQAVSDGARALPQEPYYTRLAQQLTQLLDNTNADGFCHRVDLRLRPFGNAGRLVLSFAALEHYFHSEGRDWERYAWQKARTIAGDIGKGQRFLADLRPFVYRRYLDYGALEGLRQMKASIVAEVARRDLQDDIKRGAGGIREVEFFTQVLQLVRAGRETDLQQPQLLPALQALAKAGHIQAQVAENLSESYRFLRRVENRLQMLKDAQTHSLPTDALEQWRIAYGLGYANWQALRQDLDSHRQRISAEFNALLAPRKRQPVPGALEAYWRSLPEAGELQTLLDAGFNDAAGTDALLRDFARSLGVRDLSDAASARLHRVMPALLQAAARSVQADAALCRLLGLLHNILRRTSYLALLDEQPDALARLASAMARSGFLADRIARYPLLLDELLDGREREQFTDAALLSQRCAQACAALQDDTEAALNTLNEQRQLISFRIGLNVLDALQTPQQSALQLAWLADAVLAQILQLALQQMHKAHGQVAGARFAIIGYGSLGGQELGFGSDLDLVFLYDAEPNSVSDGERPLDSARWYGRLAQKLVALLGSVTSAGKLYEVDMRLRPDGAQGLLVSSLASYRQYQHERAWTWEHQALVRARAVAGDASLCADFEQLRQQLLQQPRDFSQLHADVLQMREKMRATLDRSDAAQFDLKQGHGGLVDLEFLLQACVLAHAAQHPGLVQPRASYALIQALSALGVLPPAVQQAHTVLLDASLHCTLDRRPRLLPADSDGIATARQTITDTIQQLFATDLSG